MTWRLREATAGSGALGDLASHVVDQLHYLLGEPVVAASGHLRTFVTERLGADGPEPVTVDDAAWATLELASGATASVEVSRVATGRKNGLSIEVYGDRGSISFDLQRLNELQVLRRPGRRAAGPRQVLVTETDHPYLVGLVATGSRPGLGPHLHLAGGRAADRHRRRGVALAVVRRRHGRAAGAGRDRGQCGRLGRSRRDHAGGLMGKQFTLFTGQWADLTLEEVAGLAAGWGYDGLEIAVSGEHLDAWRWDEDGYVEERLDLLGAPWPEGAGRSATTSTARLSATTRSTSGTRPSWERRCGATATPRGCASAPRRR